MKTNSRLEVPESMGFSGLSADTKRIALPACRINFLLLWGTYKVTDEGIANGENFDGMINELYIGNASTKVVQVRRDELSQLIAMQQEEASVGRLYDAKPTTETDQQFFFLIEGPFNLQNLSSPELVLTLNAPTDEFGGATAFSADVHVSCEVAAEQSGPGAIYHREYRPTAVRHEIPLGPSMVREIYIKTGTVSEILLPASNGREEKSPSEKELDTKYPYQYLFGWQTFKHASAPTAGTYFIDNLYTENFPGRALTLVLSSTNDLLVFAKNLVV